MKSTPNDMIKGSIHKSNKCGYLEVISYANAFEVSVKFINTGETYTFEAGNIRKGCVKDLMVASVCDVGFIGRGEYLVRVNNKLTKAYQAWSDMIKRCYSEKRQKRQPTYIGCTVCKEWHNYQNFADWYYDNLPDDDLRYEVDKDIKRQGNKIYSPEFCIIVSAKENRQESNARNTTREYRIINPSGNEIVIVNMAKYCRENRLEKSGMSALIRGKLKSYKGHTLPQLSIL
ncbi:HNH endonuclease [Vibrio phage F89 g1]